MHLFRCKRAKFCQIQSGENVYKYAREYGRGTKTVRCLTNGLLASLLIEMLACGGAAQNLSGESGSVVVAVISMFSGMKFFWRHRVFG